MRIDKNAVYGIYVHIPFCLKKCSYCDFTSYPGLISRADCYLEDIYAEMEHYKGLSADSVYIGGGTPTSLPKEQLISLVSRIKDSFLLTPDCEITVECNPKTVDKEYLLALKNCGINRLSIGVQSFNDNELRLLGRIHSANEAAECLKMAVEVGFNDYNLDLMFGLPNQTLGDFKKSVKRALEFKPAHISCYSLIVEDGTPISKEIQSGSLVLPDEDTEREMYHTLIDMLSSAGYNHYEISNFAKEGKESRHNNKYWDRKPYIGLGAAAHSNIANVRFGNPESLDKYAQIARLTPPEGRKTEYLTQADEMAEFVFLGLRKICGVSKRKFSECFGVTMETIYGEEIKRFTELGFMENSGDTLKLTARGIDVSNTIFCEFLQD